MAHLAKLLSTPCRRGTATIEYAIILPVLLTFLFGIMDTGRLLWTYTTLYSATEAAARCAAINAPSCTTVSATQNYAVAAAWGLDIAASAFTVSNAACGIQVVATYQFAFVFLWSGITLTTTACYPA